MTVEATAKIKQNILIVDDHPFIIQGYKNAITRYKPHLYEYVIFEAKDCESAYHLITSSVIDFDIAFLDISMPSYEAMNLFSGEDVARLLLDKMPQAKVIMLTMFTEFLKLKTLIATINPKGLVIKNDLTFDELLIAFGAVLKDEQYYSQSIQSMLASHDDAVELDFFDKEILIHLSKGINDEDMLKFIPITLNALQVRKLNLKKILEIEGENDAQLLQTAKNKGLVF